MSEEMATAHVENGRVLVTTGWLCEHLPTTRKTLTMWAKSGMPKHARGLWDLVEVLTWRGLLGISGSSSAATIREDMTMQQQKLAMEVMLKEQQAELARFKNELNANRYISRAQVERELEKFFTVFKKSALMIPRRVAGEVGPLIGKVEAKELEARLLDMVNDALNQMSVDGVYDASG